MGKTETKRFGRYEVVEELGRGAMGVVYKARDPQIDRFVAVKTVSLWHQDPEQETEFRLRFQNEAQAAGRLHHPGIVAVFDVGENPENRDPYIVLEYVAGESLNRILAREKKLPLDRALQLAIEIAEALDYAHEQGVVHRDIKPGNILVTEAGRAKIADFGIAKLNLAHFTLPGRVLGTPAYMSPEQLSGEGSDGRSDVFSLGVILYAMLTGHSPFQGNSATTVCFKVANREPIAASALDMSLPPELDAVIARAMAKLPEDRYQRGMEFAEDLRFFQQQGKTSSTTSSLAALTGTGTRTGTVRTEKSSTNARPTALAEAENVMGRVLSGASIRDVILGAATIVLLAIIAVQSRLFVSVPKTEWSAAMPVPSAPPPTRAELTKAHPSALPQPTMPLPAVAQPTVATTEPSPKKAHARIAPAPKPPIQISEEATQSASKPAQEPEAFSTLDLAVQHQFKDATLFVWVDDKLELTLPLHGASQKKLVVFNGVRGVESETIKIPAGKHALRFRAVSTDHTVDLAKTVSAEFVAGDTKSLQLTFDKHSSGIRLAWQ